MTIGFIAFAQYTTIRSADINTNFQDINNVLYGVTGTSMFFLTSINTQPALTLELNTAPATDQDLLPIKVLGANTKSISLYIRSADQYGGIQFANGTNATIAYLYGYTNGVVLTNNLAINGPAGIILNNLSINGEVAQTISLAATAGSAGAADIHMINNGGGSIYLTASAGSPVNIGDTAINWMAMYHTGSSGIITQKNLSGAYGFGWRNTTTALMELTPSGNLVIAGTQYATTQASSSLTFNTAFDAFDVAEVGLCDRPYQNGTVVCLQEGLYAQCCHDGCLTAQIISYKPGFSIGQLNAEERMYPLAIAGRVLAHCSQRISKYQPDGKATCVVSDGKGGVRPAKDDADEMVIGVVLDVPTGPRQVGVLIARFLRHAKESFHAA